jgi:hypothetical protein
MPPSQMVDAIVVELIRQSYGLVCLVPLVGALWVVLSREQREAPRKIQELWKNHMRELEEQSKRGKK